ncbi:MAG: FecR domain-containing protein, partial [Pseudomonadota bacterium]
MRRFLLATTGIALVIASGPLGQGEAQEIGNVAAVNRDMAGTPPTASRRLLELGQNVVRNERIETSDRGAGQLLFVDQTSLTISPNTDILLDEYVYNPAEDTGDVALTMTRGALRFIGGRISKKRRALIRTPTATIGIRGGMVLIQVADDGATRVTHLAGESTTIVSFGDNDSDGFDDGPGPAELEEFVAGAPVDAPQQVTLSRTSSTATTGEPAQQGQPTEVTFTGQTSADELEEVYGSFEGNQDGGTESPPSDADVAQQTQPIAQINSEVPNGQDSQPISTSGESNEGSTSASEPQEPPQQELETTPSTETAIVEEIDTDIDTGGGTGGGTLPPLGLATGGALFVPGVGIETFVEISEGSFVGTTATGETVTLNIPTAADQLRPVNPETDSTFFAQTRFPNSGFFVIEEGDAVSSEFGALTGVGFADLDNNLFIAGLSDASEDAGLIFFGNNTPNQNAAFSFDPNAPADANSVTEFVAEASFDPSEGPGGERVSLVTNGANAPGGARILFGEVSVEPIEGGQVSELSVIAAPFEQQTTGGPRISTAIIDS